jgi:hypothetical protein
MTVSIRNIALACALAWTSGVSFAGGDDYDGPRDTEETGPVYFGFVWDARGLPVTGARVQLRAKSGKSAEASTNVLGLYRSHISKEVRPDDVEVTCEKAGYKQTRIIKRAPPGSAAMNIEIDCMLQRL